MARFTPGKALLWTLLTIPALLILSRYWSEADPWAEDFLRPTGEWSARFLVLALMLTPLSMLLPRQRWVKWLLRHRRAFGVAAFGYAAFHLAFYVIAMETLESMLAELGALGIWTGWAALLLMVPLFLTSNDLAMRALKATWKRLQRLAYPAALLTLVHWVFVHDGLTAALVTFAPLAALQLFRLTRHFTKGEKTWPTSPA